MDGSQDETQHRAAVDTWIERTVGHRSSAEIVDLFGAAFEAVWGRALTTLGEVTLTAIAERVLFTVAGLHPFLSVVPAHPNGDARWKQQLYDRMAAVPREELLDGLRFGLIELLSVIGRLTAEILSYDLHTTLGGVTTGGSYTRPATAPHAVPNPVTKARS